MVPAAVVDETVAGLLPYLEAGDILIDGGNSYYVDDIRRAKELAAKRIHHLDVGTSGGVSVKQVVLSRLRLFNHVTQPSTEERTWVTSTVREQPPVLRNYSFGG